MYSLWGSVIIFVRVLSFRSVKFPHMELRQGLARPCFDALDLIDSLSSHIPSLSHNVSIILGRASNSFELAVRLSLVLES